MSFHGTIGASLIQEKPGPVGGAWQMRAKENGMICSFDEDLQ